MAKTADSNFSCADCARVSSVNRGRRTFASRCVPLLRLIRRSPRAVASGFFVVLFGLAVSSPAHAVVADAFLSGITLSPGGAVTAVALQPYGQVLAGGNFTADGGQINLVRLREDGTTDTDFKTAEVDGTVRGITVLPNGQILIVGSFTKVRSTTQAVGAGTTRNGIALLAPDGTLDTAFDPNATAGTLGNVFRVLRLASGKLLVGGAFTGIGGTTKSLLARLNSDGSVDTSFDAGSMNGSSYVWNFAETPDGKILVCGHFTTMGNAAHTNVARLNADGSNDATFSANVANAGNSYASVFNMLQQPNGSIVISGTFNRVNGIVHNNLARLGADGTADSFGTAAATDGPIHSALQQPDGAIVIGGSFTSINGLANYAKLARITPAAGTIDTTFVSPVIAGGDVFGLARQPDGKILTGGTLTSVDGQTAKYVTRVYGTPLLPLAGVTQVSSGTWSGCMVLANGQARCTGILTGNGNNYDHGTTLVRSLPVVVSALGNSAAQVSNGLYSTCVVTGSGGAKCWGQNSNGQLGDGTTAFRQVPTDVSGLGSGVQAIESGGDHTCAVSTAGALSCWGYNSTGQLGDDTQIQRLTPVPVFGLSSGVQAVSLGDSHTCALTTAGAVQCWGLNHDGQLGDNTTIDRKKPVGVVGLSSGVIAISAGRFFTCALKSGGAVQCWGSNAYGQLGDGTTTSRLTPVAALGLGSGTHMVSAGAYHACAIDSGGQALCWGTNGYGELGDGTRSSRSTPQPVVGLGGVATSIDAGFYRTFATLDSGAAKSWGSDLDWALGNGSRGIRILPDTINRYAYTVSTSASAGGAISPAGAMLFDAGQAALVSITPSANHRVSSVVSSCGGSLSGTVFTTDIIGIDCSIVATFVDDTYTVTPSVAGGHGSITPGTPQSIHAGATTTFTLAADVGYHASVGGTCGGTLAANVYTTNPVSADCTVIASFAVDTFTVTPSVVGSHGTITPAVAQTVAFGATASFTLAPETGYHASIAGSCGGALVGNVYTTNAVSADCTVIASFAIDSFTVTPSVSGSHGSITPATPQTVTVGGSASFTVVADTGYYAVVTGSCGGTLAGDLYTTSAIASDCAVIASFVIDTFTVTPSVAGGHGTIAPSTPRTLAFGSVTSFTLTPDSNYQASVGGTCGGSLVGNVFTTNPVSADCSVIATFTITSFTVTPSVSGGHGTITPSTPQTIASGGTKTFTLVPEVSYLATVSGTCGGSFVATNVYTTDAVTTDCTVVANFLHAQASLSIDDARDYVRYGITVDYLVTLVNNGEVGLTGQVSGMMPPQLDSAATTWICVEPHPGVVCVASGQGPLNDYVLLPAGSSIKWLVSAPVRLDAQEPFVDNAVSFTTPTLATPVYATDHDTLVLFRNGFDHDDDDGADGIAIDRD